MTTFTLTPDGQIKCGRCWHLNEPGRTGCGHCNNTWGLDALPLLPQARAQAEQNVARDKAGGQARYQSGRVRTGTGLAVAVVGALVTWGTHAAASNSGGGRYVIAWGAIVFGLVHAVRGLVDWMGGRPDVG